MSVKTFYNEFIFQTRATHHQRIKDALVPRIEAALPMTAGNQVGKWFCELNTEFFAANPDVGKYMDLITGEVYPALDRMFAAMPTLNQPRTSTVSHIWYNRYEAGNTQEVHSHAKGTRTMPSVSGVYILELNEPNPLVFFSQAAAANPLVAEAIRMEDATEGDIILFPSALPHYVLPCKARRTTIAFNIVCEF